MALEEGETLQTLLNKATSPLNREEDWEYIMNFCERVNFELEGAQNSTRLLAHKIQSPQEREAMQALIVLESCVKNCGESFQKELGKYRFLNEMIKIVSPKYLGTRTPKKVQEKVIQLLYTWSIALTDQVKIRDAYQMLKKQGIVTKDPDYDHTLVQNPPPPKDDRDSLFKDEDKKKQLERLLKSSRPEDLQAANRLIKNVVKEDEDKVEKLKKRHSTLEEVTNNIRVLNEMLTHFTSTESSIADMQTMKELYDSCQKLRPTLFRLASDTDDDESALMEILRANDDVSRVMQSFEKLVQPKLRSMTDRKADGSAEPDTPKPETSHPDSTSNLNDLTGISLNSSRTPSNGLLFDAFPSTPANTNPAHMTSIGGGFDDSLLLNFQSAQTSTADVNSLFDNFSLPQNAVKEAPTPGLPSLINSTTPQIPLICKPPTSTNAKTEMFSDIDMLSKNLMEKSLGHRIEGKFTEPVKPTLNQLSSTTQPAKDQQPNLAPTLFDMDPILTNLAPAPSTSSNNGISSNELDIFTAGLNFSSAAKKTQNMELTTTANTPASTNDLFNSEPITTIPQPVPQKPEPVAVKAAVPDISLTDVSVALESIRPSTYTPITAYDNNGIRIMVHFAKDHALPSRPDTLVSVVSIMSTRTNPVENILFQAAAPKIMRVKLQPPSNTQLSAFNPIFSTPPITQVMIIANPEKKYVKLRFKLDYKIDSQTSLSENGIITGFPPGEKWGNV